MKKFAEPKRPWRNAARHVWWFENRLLKYHAVGRTPFAIRLVGELWGRGQIAIMLDDGEWRGRIRTCTFVGILPKCQGVNITVSLYWFAHKRVRKWKDSFGIDRTEEIWDYVHHPYTLPLSIVKVQQTKTKPRQLHFRTVEGHSGYFSLRVDAGNVRWKNQKMESLAHA